VLDKETLRKLREEIAPHPGPVLSLYLNTNPASEDVLQYSAAGKSKPYVIRAKDTLKELGVPGEISRRVLERLEHDVISGRTRAVFADEDNLTVVDLNVDLPVVDLSSGKLEAHWGEPYVLPLLLALDEFERYAVILLDEERWRLFEVYLGEVREIADAFRAVDSDNWRKLAEAKPGTPFGVAARGGSGQDRYDRRMLAWTHRFYRRLAAETGGWLERLGAERLILMGQSEEAKYFENLLPKAVRQRVVARLPLPPGGSKVEPSAVLRAVEVKIAEIERAQEAKLLDRIREEGTWGLAQVLRALQEGRVHLLVMPWRPAGSVWRCRENGYYDVAKERLEQLCPGGVDEAPLAQALVDLAELFAVEIEFVRGENAELVEREFAGLAALKRW